MVFKTALFTLFSTLFIGVMALSWDATKSSQNYASGNGGNWRGGGTQTGTYGAVTGASATYSQGGQTGGWNAGGGTYGNLPMTGASASVGAGGSRGGWGGEREGFDDDHFEGGDWDDD